MLDGEADTIWGLSRRVRGTAIVRDGDTTLRENSNDLMLFD